MSIMVFMKNKNSINKFLNNNILYKIKYYNKILFLFLFINLNFINCTIKQVGIDKIFSYYSVIIEGNYNQNYNNNYEIYYIKELKNYYKYDQTKLTWSSNWSFLNKNTTDKIYNTIYFYTVIKNDSIYAQGYIDIPKILEYSKETSQELSKVTSNVLSKEEFWDTDLDFAREEKRISIDFGDETVGSLGNFNILEDSPHYINPKNNIKEKIHVFYKTYLNQSKISTPAYILRNYRLYNKLNSNIKVKVYKAYIENEYDISLTSNMITQNINISPPLPPIKSYIVDPNSVDGYIWKLNPFWEKDIASNTIETIFYSNNDYLGPFLIKIYDTNDNLLFTDRVKYVFPKVTNGTKNFATQLEWKKKSNTTTTILTIASVSDYNYEFYAEYPK